MNDQMTPDELRAAADRTAGGYAWGDHQTEQADNELLESAARRLADVIEYAEELSDAPEHPLEAYHRAMILDLARGGDQRQERTMSGEMVEPVKREMTEPVYVLRGGVYLLDEHAGVLIDSAGNFSAKTRGNPRSLAVLLRAIAESIEDDVEAGETNERENDERVR